MHETMTTSSGDQMVLSDSLFSSDIQKRIRRNFFKKDVTLKSYKCTFLGDDINTPAKIYISNYAIYVVHRPKRRKLTTIPFSGVNHIRQRSGELSLELSIKNGTVYTLANFQRAEPAIAFLVNFWNLVRKEKILSKYTGSPCAICTENCVSDEQASDVGLPSMNSSLLPKAPTTISLNSSASVSETDSLESRRLSSAWKKSLSIVNLQPSSELINRQLLSGSWSGGNQSSREHVSNADHTLPVETVVSTQIPTLSRDVPMKPSPPHLHTTNAPSSSCSSINVDPDYVTIQRPAVAPLMRAELAVSLSPSEKKNSISFPVGRCSSASGAPQPALYMEKPTASIRLTENSGWGVWPFGFLPYPFAFPPQRLTVIIAYAILGFLLVSTMHLYHRLAVFDLHDHPNLDVHSMVSLSSSEPENVRLNTELLETQLVQLVELTGQLTNSLMQLTNDVRTLQFEMQSLSPTTKSVPLP
ncbi:hypothetical protein EG68_10405 [Paragonimus skrjabini miyazakii]|uniref:GRAM domain-containing protein n=1 Tax=Paragonimus skrjabini miyazakii TaxID=59628 RepID=A0A8S9YNM9_9TREM|nr:hypothetical protein EG68_10405 [Paragonimus skrjabini miyazakii]